jgi:predicted TIM-barrel fold metal-dependent hydrolase
MPEFEAAIDLVDRHPNVYLDTTMVGVPFTERMTPLPVDWPQRLAGIADRVVLGTDFPNIPHDYATQLRAIAGWAAAHDELGEKFLRAVLHDTPSALLDGEAV